LAAQGVVENGILSLDLNDVTEKRRSAAERNSREH